MGHYQGFVFLLEMRPVVFFACIPAKGFLVATNNMSNESPQSGLHHSARNLNMEGLTLVFLRSFNAILEWICVD